MMDGRLCLIGGLCCLLWTSTCSGERQLYVSPTAATGGDGSADRPLATLPQVLDRLEAAHREGRDGDITINLLNGVYRLEDPLRIGPEHLPANGGRLVFAAAAGARPLLSGGQLIRGWRRTDDGTLVATVPAVAAGDRAFRELFVNGQRRPRARHPNRGYHRIVEAFPDKRTGFVFADGDLPDGIGSGAELVFLHDWSISRIAVQSVDDDRRRLTVEHNIGNRADHYKIDHFEKQPRYFLENHPRLLDAPGEWYLDVKRGELFYRPLPGETDENIEATAPRVTELLVVQGTDKHAVRNVHFHGLTFQHARWSLPPGGYASGQASVHEHRDFSDAHETRKMMESAIQFERAEDCSLSDCRIAHLGLSGVSFGSRTTRCRLEACLLEDISGNSINLGEDASRRVNGRPWLQAAPEQAASSHVITNNVIREGGRQFYGSVAVWVGLAHHMRIAHNLIHDHPYSGVSLGWMWNPTPTPAGHNVVEHNHIHHVMQVLSDGGGIYTLGSQPRSSLSHNHIHDIPLNAGRAESNGMFLDQGSDQFTIRGNVIYGIARSPLRFHQAVHNVVEDNLLAVPRKEVPHIRYNRTDAKTIRQEGNTVVTDEEFSPGACQNVIDAAGLKRPLPPWFE